MATERVPHAFDLDTLDIATVDLPGGDALIEAMGFGLGNTEVGASGCSSGKSWLV
ncbi:hypothetical protein AB0395_29095 [Streptosporangium sp. NPDC051023]|uniref:hypothetical protein n=1 Tax=Streptosporangium sp. NPDC051023 TaxID=3155410 RepID=UPI003450B278